MENDVKGRWIQAGRGVTDHVQWQRGICHRDLSSDVTRSHPYPRSQESTDPPSLPSASVCATAGSGQGGRAGGAAVMNRKVPYLLGQCPQPVGLQRQEGGSDKKGENTRPTENQNKQHVHGYINKTTRQLKMGWRRGRVREESAESREQSKKIKNNVKYGNFKINHCTIKD